MPEDKPAILHTESSCGWGGQEIRILEEARLLAGRGYRIEIACPPESTLYARAPDWGFKPTALPIARRSVTGLLALRALLTQYRRGVVNTHSSTDSWLVGIASRSLLHRPALVRTRHVSTPMSSSPLSKWLYAHAPDHVVTTGTALREMLIRRTGIKRERVTSIPTGIDPQRFFPGDPRDARNRLGMNPLVPLVGIVATIRSWKGHRYLLEAMAMAKLVEWHLAIVGDGPYIGTVRECVAALGLGAQVHFVGHQDNPQDWLQAMDIVCQPSYANEGISQSILQAMMTGLPVIATPVGSTSEAVLDGSTGLLVPVKDSVSLARALQSLASDPDLRRRMGHRARELAMAEFSIDMMADRMERVFVNVRSQRARSV